MAKFHYIYIWPQNLRKTQDSEDDGPRQAASRSLHRSRVSSFSSTLRTLPCWAQETWKELPRESQKAPLREHQKVEMKELWMACRKVEMREHRKVEMRELLMACRTVESMERRMDCRKERLRELQKERD